MAATHQAAGMAATGAGSTAGAGARGHRGTPTDVSTGEVVLCVAKLQTTAIPAPKAPSLHEIWNWEGDTTILPGKWSRIVLDAFGEDGQ